MAQPFIALPTAARPLRDFWLARGDIASRPVSGIAPAQLAVIWRTDDHRSAVRDFIACC